jgi:hypothetical protein
VSKPAATPYEAYSAFTGMRDGWAAMCCHLLIDMQTFTLAQAPELKVNAPSFKQSMQRPDGMLKNMRLRSTKPAMPELVDRQR